MEPVTGFSAAERERRWRETGRRMEQAGIQALVMPPGLGATGPLSANQRYLLNVPDDPAPVAAIFPIQQSPTLVMAHDALDHVGPDVWAEDIRPSEGGRWGDVLANRLKELGLADATLGVPYLNGDAELGESPLLAGTLAALQSFHLVDATALMLDQRRVKSAEEIAAIECACGVADAAIFRLGYEMRAGMSQREALSILEATILRNGAAPGHAARWICGPAPTGAPGVATAAPLAWGDVLNPELAPRVAGYAGIESHALCIGKPPQQIYGMFERAFQCFEASLPNLTPGRSLDLALVTAPDDGEASFAVTFHVANVGLAEERINPSAEGRAPLVEGQVLAVKPIARDRDGTTISFCSTVAITAEGARRLSRRPLELMLTSRSLLSAYSPWRSPEPTPPWLAGTAH